jgi:hypothetical protein
MMDQFFVAQFRLLQLGRQSHVWTYTASDLSLDQDGDGEILLGIEKAALSEWRRVASLGSTTLEFQVFLADPVIIEYINHIRGMYDE